MSQSTMLRIHGDNIVECDRALILIAESFGGTIHYVPSAVYLPRFEIRSGKAGTLFAVELLAGHSRWGVDAQKQMQNSGSPLHESTDALVTKLLPDGTEEIVVAIEFSSALPAGNNAWQRTGRALACATIRMPYLYFAEVGGVELNEQREKKASRLPTPLIPFSFITASKFLNLTCLPVYSASPSCGDDLLQVFRHAFGKQDGQMIVRQILEGVDASAHHDSLSLKALAMTQTLSAQRRRTDTLRGEEWGELLQASLPQKKTQWLEAKHLM